jgi:acetyltransferase-like isoleucine patch superfamily enzyme
MCGYKIGEGTFIGMHCYLDDLCYDKIEIGKNVTISYGVYFACHGRKQGHNKIVIEDGAYIGMRANIIAPKDVTIGAGAIVGAASLVNRSVAPGEIVAGVPAKPLHPKE